MGYWLCEEILASKKAPLDILISVLVPCLNLPWHFLSLDWPTTRLGQMSATHQTDRQGIMSSALARLCKPLSPVG
jgi:hypothetical protein